MPNKCCIYNCKTNYDSQKNKPKISCYSFPKDPIRRQEWIDNIPRHEWNSGTVGKHMVICSLHWPADVPMLRKSRYPSPAVPPTIFTNIPLSHQRAHIKPRTTQNSVTDFRDRQMDIDELPQFDELDLLKNYKSKTNFHHKCSPFHDKFIDELLPHDVIVSDEKEMNYIHLTSQRRWPVLHFLSIFNCVWRRMKQWNI